LLFPVNSRSRVGTGPSHAERHNLQVGASGRGEVETCSTAEQIRKCRVRSVYHPLGGTNRESPKLKGFLQDAMGHGKSENRTRNALR
jgi:hypothetical protein